MKSDLIDLTMQLHHQTGRGVLVSDDGLREHAVWLPKSEVEMEAKDRGLVVITLPEWLAVEKGLV